MKITNLIEHIETNDDDDDDDIELKFESGTLKAISKSSWLILFETRALLLTFLQRNKEYFKNNTLQITTQRRNSSSTIVSIDSIGDLITQLRDISNGIHKILNFPNKLKLIIISNLSDYYWDLQNLNQRNYSDFNLNRYLSNEEIYKELILLVNKIKVKYNCVVIILSFDAMFEGGLNSDNKTYYYKSEIQKYSRLPKLFLENLNHICHVAEFTEKLNKIENEWEVVSQF
ncbi:uncharacterized protein KGF55_003041 [Candida pseudojiufengensis]|uniref:uncharacterized protein n=1 Tax=Candida pseudojiufengensis TaxID=497109 RepID=UPI0022246A8C|nr:uncharacterized protein KGF55_003041 [Candida pseudojiufengensis]KAI5963249.1 hypothetical protein KGF55_003041 [Candida pseudojiufengensis]